MPNTDLTRTTGTPTNVDKFTISVWLKRGNIGINASIIGNRADGNNRSEFSFRTDDTLRWEHVDGGSNVFYFQTNRKFRDTNAWYHIVFGYDSSQGTSSNRWKLYINGVQETSFSASMRVTFLLSIAANSIECFPRNPLKFSTSKDLILIG